MCICIQISYHIWHIYLFMLTFSTVFPVHGLAVYIEVDLGMDVDGDFVKRG